jgi:hypothetical protein
MHASVTQIPRRGFARGAVVRKKEGGPNMLVVRQLDQMTACFLIESDQPGAVCIGQFATFDLEQIVPPWTQE